ncbi:CapA family protein [Methanohalophilus sp.]|uniref:CapA family protein n=1 Tax=Methanohalophilus sp. TaxID=1966352 RepID=UPI00260AC465|nr:CapA family protein [Methanohalophilus sp.]MDK2892491.1 hypothetical protein [Methanohalophilus sp.]
MSIKLFFCGDIVISEKRNEFISSEMLELIHDCDLSVCNFEAPIKSNGKAIPKAGPHLFQYEGAIALIKKSGFNVCTLANNHIYDYGDKGLRKTLDVFGESGLKTIGAGMDFESAYEPLILTIKEIKIGLISFCEGEFGSYLKKENRGGYAYINNVIVNGIVQRTKLQVDFLIIIVHAGVEEVPLPLPEWRERYRNLCDLGADVIIGHHPHVPQGIEEYNKSFIFYSLGNFFMDWGKYRTKSDYGYSVILELNSNSINYKIIPHKKKDGNISICADQKYLSYLKKLNSWLEHDYNILSTQQYIYLYYTRYRKYYKIGLNSIDEITNILLNMKSTIQHVLLRKNKSIDKNLLLLHNIRIDSHRFSMQEALSLLHEKNFHGNYSKFNSIMAETAEFLEDDKTDE